MGVLVKCFRNAFVGIGHVIRTQRNAKIHLAFTIVVVVLGIWLGIASSDWVALLLAAGLVWTAELVNTSIEYTVDLASSDRSELARIAKDVSAGAVLLAATAATIVGALVFTPELLRRFGA